MRRLALVLHCGAFALAHAASIPVALLSRTQPAGQLAAPCACPAFLAVAQPVPPGTPCPCLNTPPPLVSPAEVARTQVQAAAAEATQAALTELEESAKKAGDPWVEELAPNEVKVAGVKENLKNDFKKVQEETLTQFEAKLKAEKDSEEAATKAEYAAIGAKAEASAKEIGVVSQEFATNRAHQILASDTSGSFMRIMQMEAQAEQLKQASLKLAEASINAAINSKTVSAQAASAQQHVSKDSVDKAVEVAKMIKTEASMMEDQAKAAEQLAKDAAKLVTESSTIANSVLLRATTVEDSAEKALEQARTNTQRLTDLKAKVLAMKSQATTVVKK